jgi:hypothetical protein
MLLRRWVVVAMLGAAACSDEVEVGSNFGLTETGGSGAAAGSGGSGGAAGSAGTGGAGAEGGVGGSGGGAECVPVACNGQSFQCGDCRDNDQDGSVDAFDPECLGPCDDEEDSFYGGIPGNSTPCRQDCYFDNDSGSGNDDCYWSHRCDPLSVAPDYPPSGDARCDYDPTTTVPGSSAMCAELSTTQSQRCQETCQPLTPNGCDCFGCCELPYGSGIHVFIGANSGGVGTCDLASAGDPTRCPRCRPVRGCFNPCDPCEVCVGRPPGDRGSCTDAGDEPQNCAPGRTPCGRPGQAPCGPNQYCITGCCIAIPA